MMNFIFECVLFFVREAVKYLVFSPKEDLFINKQLNIVLHTDVLWLCLPKLKRSFSYERKISIRLSKSHLINYFQKRKSFQNLTSLLLKLQEIEFSALFFCWKILCFYLISTATFLQRLILSQKWQIFTILFMSIRHFLCCQVSVESTKTFLKPPLHLIRNLRQISLLSDRYLHNKRAK